VAQGLAGKRDCVKECPPAFTRLCTESQVEAVRELDAWPCIIALEERFADSDGGRVVGGLSWVNDADERGALGSVIEGKVLGVSANTNNWVGSGDGADVVDEVLRVSVWVGEVACWCCQFSVDILENELGEGVQQTSIFRERGEFDREAYKAVEGLAGSGGIGWDVS
jgi:hypothetical protein